jgi:hypothetical protein
MSKKYQSGAIIAVFLLLIASAFAGSGPRFVGIHEECIDGIDNEGDGDIDVYDNECYFYPFEDGNGEEDTPVNQRYTENRYVSLFDYHLQYAPPGSEEATVCFALSVQLYDESDEQKAQNWVDENQVNCDGQGP